MSEKQALKPEEDFVERVLVVDDHNHVVGAVPRTDMRVQGLCHRAAYVFVFNSEGKLFVQERSLGKDIFPGMFDPATGGVVADGESYDETAIRELHEELGIENIPLTPHFHFYFHESSCQVWGRVYSCRYDGPVKLQKEEVTSVVMESPEDILGNRFHRNYTPDSLRALERLVHCLEQL